MEFNPDLDSIKFGWCPSTFSKSYRRRSAVITFYLTDLFSEDNRGQVASMGEPPGISTAGFLQTGCPACQRTEGSNIYEKIMESKRSHFCE